VYHSGSGVLGSSIAFHKPTCKRLAKSAGVRVIDGAEFHMDEIARLNARSSEYPFIIKPASNGSSVGVYLISNEDDLKSFKESDWTYGSEIMIEKYIAGREFTVLVIDGTAIGAVEITHKNTIYDYVSKYDEGGSVHMSSFEIDDRALREMYEMSESVFKACYCSGLARVDFRFDGKDPYFMEINTQPGMTSLSLVPDIAKANGLSLSDMLNDMMQRSMSAHAVDS
jgi:D-alanine--D-alanine ligase